MAKIPKARIGEIMQTTLSELAALGGEARLREIFAAVEPKLVLSDYERATTEKSGFERWRTIIHFYSIDLVKCGWLTKEGGKWLITPAGRSALKLSAESFFLEANKGYRIWKSGQSVPPIPEPDEGGSEAERQTAYDQAVELARAEIEEHIDALGPYDFQKLVAELLVAMGYHVPFVAPAGPDGGIDIVAYKDPLGTTAPRIRVQVKHREQKVTVNQVRELEGLLKKEGDIGLMVSSGGFTADALREIRSSHRHIETMDLNRLIRLWQEHYDKLREQAKKLVPLVRVFFLAPAEES